jgi:putative endonuclease
MNTREKGRIGEELAGEYLKKNNYKIIEKNYYTRWGEIDLVAQDNSNGELVFVEVKMRNSRACGFPEEAVDEKKLNKLAMAAEIYLDKEKIDGNYRFDCLAIVKEREQRRIVIKHYKNIGLN